MFDPTDLLGIYRKLARVPGGKRIFSKAVGMAAPYTGTLPFTVEDLAAGRAKVRLHDKRIVRNHLQSVHAIALMNLGEVSTGLAMYAGLPKGARGIITDLGMSYLKKARGSIVAECVADVPRAAGRHDLTVEAVLRDASGAEVARARAVWRIDIP
jgi:acyl-coenzyme A thioesterase PaaI-like protein